MRLNVCIGYEESGEVREAFRRRGHNAWSVDLLPARDGSPYHIQEDFRHAICRSQFCDLDLLIVHPPCTYLCVSGLHWNKRKPERKALHDAALEEVRWLLDLPYGKIALENPVGAISRHVRKPDQKIQPWQFGHPESKLTCFWLKGLPLLVPTNVLIPEQMQANGKSPRWNNQTPTGQNKLGPSAGRAQERAKTYLGIADAMAVQWGRA